MTVPSAANATLPKAPEHGDNAIADLLAQPELETHPMTLDDMPVQLVWPHSGLNNWYRNASGGGVTNSPWRRCEYRNFTAEFDPNEYPIETVALATEKADA